MIFCKAVSLCEGSNDFYSRRRLVSDEDKKLIKKLKNPNRDAYKEAAKGADRGIIKADEYVRAIQDAEGYKFASGRVFKAETSVLMDAYVVYVIAYTKKDDCENAKKYMDKIKGLASSDFQTVDYKYNIVYDPVLDRNKYSDYRQDVLAYFAYLLKDSNKCVEPNEIKAFLYSEKDYEYKVGFSWLSDNLSISMKDNNCGETIDEMKDLPVRKEEVEWLRKYVDPDNVCISKAEFDALAANAVK